MDYLKLLKDVRKTRKVCLEQNYALALLNKCIWTMKKYAFLKKLPIYPI